MTDTMPTRNNPAIDMLLAMCGGLIALCGTLSATSIVMDIHRAVPIALSVTGAVAGALQLALNDYVQRRTTMNTDILEARVDGQVIAGPANDRLDTGSVVRDMDPQVPVEGELFLDGR